MNTKTEHLVIPYSQSEYNPAEGFYRIGDGQMGGKGNGLARLNEWLREHPASTDRKRPVRVSIPCTVVIATDLFDHFMHLNGLTPQAMTGLTDAAVSKRFGDSRLPEKLTEQLRGYLTKTSYPLAVRSSSLMEDNRQHGYAGLYRSHMLTNDQKEPEQRLESLKTAIKQVYASTYFADPRAYARRMGHDEKKEKMAVLIQQLVGRRYGNLFFPAVAGVVQSENDYPLPPMRREYGLATIAMGLGITVAQGERSMRFCPRRPQALPQQEGDRSVLENSQRYFYGLAMGGPAGADQQTTEALVRKNIADAADTTAMQWVASTWVADEQRLRDTIHIPGSRVITFAPILKHERLPLAETLCDLLELAKMHTGEAVEVEFALDPADEPEAPACLAVLQIRPMAARPFSAPVDISEEELQSAVCVSGQALGNTNDPTMIDVVYVKPESFDPARTVAMADQVARINALLERAHRRYLLIGPGRWGSQDRWLGIPVKWRQISNVGAIVETSNERLHAEPSQGAHLFNNLAAAGICYLCVSPRPPDKMDANWLDRQPRANETEFVAHLQLPRPIHVKVDARRSLGVITWQEAPLPFNH